MFKGGIDKGAYVPAVHELIGSFAGSVVPARQHLGHKINAAATEVLDHLEGVFAEEGKVVGGMNEQDFSGVGGKLVHVMRPG